MPGKKNIDRLVREFHQEMVALVKKYQFRDRNQMTACGISVSQCYVLETLHRDGSLNMNQLADKMHLKISTVTRVVEQLVKHNYVVREEDENDRRVRLIHMTTQGEEIFQRSWQAVFASEKKILENFPAEQRELLIALLRRLNSAVTEWQSGGCCR